MATIKDVARRACVSISTVSHVLNGTRFVSEDTTQQVQQAVKDLNYKPSALARSLKTNRTNTIGMLTGSNTNPFFAEVIHGVEACCYERGYHLVLCNSGDDLNKQASYLQTLEEKRIDGLLVMSANSDPAFFDLLRDRQSDRRVRPLVVLDCHEPNLEADIIMEDPEQGGYEATRYLLAHGHTAIGCISGPKGISPSSGRLAGYGRAMAEAGRRVDNNWLLEGELTAESGYQQAVKLLNHGKLPTALFIGNDLMAMGVMCAIQERGFKIPQDISVIGYDNIELAAYTFPPLTTINQPKSELGRLAANTLIDRIENPAIKPEVRTLRSTLVERQSVRPVSKN